MEIKNLYSLTLHEIILYSIKLYEETKEIEKEYPNYKNWFIHKQIKELLEGKRDILFVEKDNKIIALACLKKNENKICTLYVKEEYRKQKIGTKLLEESMKYLKTTKPFITISENKLSMFKSFINKYKWEIIEVNNNVYNHKEYCLNGYITKKSYTK